MKKLLLGAMNNKKSNDRPFQLQVNVTRTMAILRYALYRLSPLDTMATAKPFYA